MGCLRQRSLLTLPYPACCRWFTIAERKRAQSMPDRFMLVGSMEEQSKQVGESCSCNYSYGGDSELVHAGG